MPIIRLHALDRTRLRFSGLIFIAACLLWPVLVNAGDMHVWTDGQGRKQVSTIPQHGFDANGDIRRSYDPNSIQYQHLMLRKSLREQAEALAAAEISDSEVSLDLPADSRPVVRAPREGIMGLRQLIQLERRGGRYEEQ
ncbi:MAG: hypothetical protein AAF387_09605 [Pseudomonadota bacterium]